MVKKTFLKECFRSIRGSFSRFLAIFLIVALGSGFLAGLLATTPDMRHTMSELYRETNLFDLRVAGNLGLEDADAAALAAVPGIRAVMPARTTDREITLSSGDMLAARFHGVTGWEGDDAALMNRGSLVEGRWPQSPDECVVEISSDLYQGGLAVGQRVTVLPLEADEEGEEPDDPFTVKEFTIVGTVTSSYYISMVQRGSTTMGSGTLGAILYVWDDVLDMDYYTDLYATVEGGDTAEAFTEAYDDLVAPIQEAVEAMADTQKHVRADRLRGDAQEELDEAKQELADKTAEGEQELADALKELEDGEREYADGLVELEDGRKELADAYQKLLDAEAELPDGLKKLEDGEREYADGLKELEDGQKEIDDAQKELDDAYVQLEDAMRELKDALVILESGQADLDSGRAQLDAAQKQLDDGKAQLEAGREQLNAGQAQLDAGKAELENQERMLEMGHQFGMVSDEDYQAAKAQIEAAKQELKQNQAYLDQQKAYLKEQQAVLDAGQAEIDSGRRQLRAGANELEQGWADYNAGLKEVEDADVERRLGLYQLQLAREELEEGRQELADARVELDDGWAEYYDGVAELKQAWKDFYDGQEELADAEIELADARIKLDDGWVEYQDGKLEFEEKIYDANVKIRDAQDQIDDIDDPEWYVMTRSECNESYIFYQSDTEKVAAIAKVFPIFFFMVAALVASTTMTRMIDEDRGSIGTLKALGYSNGSIAGKYLLYAFLACLSGACVGLGIFLPLFPRVLVQAYELMYVIPPLKASSHGTFILLSAGMILLAVVLSTLGALKGSLQDNAATLMRPKAPPAGKRILLERIKPLWRRMKFTHKVTARNLFRYKKRFFMTVVGIAGCTALLVAGFGLRDSIGDIVDVQFTQLQNYDMTLTLKHEGDDTFDREIAALLSDPTVVSQYTAVHMETGEGFTQGRDTTLYIVVPSDMEVFPQYHTFRDRVTGTPVDFTSAGAVLTEKAARVLGVEAGGTLNLRNQDEVAATVPVTGICENYVQGYVFLPRAVYEQAFGQECVFDTVLAKTLCADQRDRDALATALLESSNSAGVAFSTTTIETFADMLASVDYIIILLIVAAAALAFVVLYNLTNINICERQKEIATLKVLGFFKGEVSGYIFRETVILSLIGTAAGLVIGAGFHQFVVQTAEVDAVMFGRIVKPISYGYSFALSMVFTLLVSLVMQRKLRKIDMVESLKAPE
ncbi:MAG: ABC transporter permease [Clostridia bacterium]|nr:ABC transporter permease [Clostridia bacterium]